VGCTEDLDSLKVWIESMHPDHLSRISDSVWNDAIQRAHESLGDSLSLWDFSQTVGEVIGTLRDSHSLVLLGKWQGGLAHKHGKCNLELKYIDDKFYVKNGPLMVVERGTEITEINGIPVLELLETAMKVVPSEGDSYISKLRIAELFINDIAIEESVIENNSIALLLSDGSTIEYPLIKVDGSKKRKRDYKIEDEDVIEWVWPEGGKGMVILKVKSFDMGTSRRFYKNLEKGFKKLRKANKLGGIEGLAIDLRGNLGGDAWRVEGLFNYIVDEEFFAPNAIIVRQCKESKEEFNETYKGLVKWLADRFGHKVSELADIKRLALLEIGETDTLFFEPTLDESKNKFLGNCCVLIDGLSASGSVEFTALFEMHGKGPIIGEPCMGPSTGTFANPIYRMLPNSEIGVFISSAQFCLDTSYRWSPTPIQPTRWVQYCAEDLKEERDPYLLAIQDWLDYPEVSIEHEFSNRESHRLFGELESAFSSNRKWRGVLRKEVFDEIVTCDICISELKKELKLIERSDASEDDIYMQMLNNKQKQKDCLEHRNASINIKLHSDMRAIFSELTSPFRPAVLHFGIHNRADCNVCKTN
jgi:hypothetical protein